MAETIRLNTASGRQEFQLPPTPLSECAPVSAWSESVVIPTYMPASPDRNPMFLETRVYQGSSGAIYPLPFIDRIAAEPKPRAWQAVHLENEWIRLMILPEIGGRIHVGFDKVNGYDFFLSPERDQAGAGGTGWSVGFRRRRIQLAAAPSSSNVPAGGNKH